MSWVFKDGAAGCSMICYWKEFCGTTLGMGRSTYSGYQDVLPAVVRSESHSRKNISHTGHEGSIDLSRGHGHTGLGQVRCQHGRRIYLESPPF